ncbi:hypothetical protein P171DRAFT_430523 [Karstenula rhodostoma CBS 690.94]|uniref:Secreted protein n=1 Tax=Karstenula rhodostoma CBS 690.94 TaxID=1392251 RepID=A0A9P4UEM3_9PLEO|nr:hypothetical protein P171DRAFT_430523 [Karstenula rhodostoma CBS 690.94]
MIYLLLLLPAASVSTLSLPADKPRDVILLPPHRACHRYVNALGAPPVACTRSWAPITCPGAPFTSPGAPTLALRAPCVSLFSTALAAFARQRHVAGAVLPWSHHDR